jgi:C4-dicarboxylate-specific signal transduction histidine kinase
VQGKHALARQALHSVISNAVENLRGGGELHIALREPAAGDGVDLVVSDTGTRERASVARAPQAARGPGFGAGLPMLNRAMERFGGSVSLTRAKGAGNEVRLHFSLCPCEA